MLHHLYSNWVKRHMSIKHQHAKITGQRRALGMKRALEDEGLERTHHRGIYDARNIAKIFLKYFDEWDRR